MISTCPSGTRYLSTDGVEAFFLRARFKHGATIEQVGGKWVVKLPGWEQQA